MEQGLASPMMQQGLASPMMQGLASPVQMQGLASPVQMQQGLASPVQMQQGLASPVQMQGLASPLVENLASALGEAVPPSPTVAGDTTEEEEEDDDNKTIIPETQDRKKYFLLFWCAYEEFCKQETLNIIKHPHPRQCSPVSPARLHEVSSPVAAPQPHGTNYKVLLLPQGC